MKRKLCILLTLVILTAMLAVPSQATQQNRYANHIVTARNGVVRIFTTAPPYIMGSYGSGFAIGIAGEPTDIFATNFHVVEDSTDVYILLDNDWRSSIPEIGGNYDNVHAVRCKVLYQSISGPDYAILQAERIITERVALPIMDTEQAYPGDTVFALGYPSVADEVTDTIPADVDSMTVTRGTISRMTYFDGAHSDVIQIDADINHGNSGGPLVTEQGYVIGLNTWGVGNEDGMVNLALFVNYVTTKLDELIADGTLAGFTYTHITQRPEDDAAPPASHAPSEEAKPVDNEPNSTLLYVAAGVCLLLLVVILLVVRKSKAKSNTSSENKPAVTSVQNSPFVLHGISGQFAGFQCPVDKPIRIGRTSDFEITFADTTPGISRNHCQIVPDNNCVVLTDLGSSMGTFLSNGTRLTPNQSYRLMNGDVFYLGNRDQSFRVLIPGQQPPAQSIQQPQKSVSAQYTLVGADGPYAGRRISIDRDLTLGRSSECTVPFAQNASGVSSRHCMLSPRDNGVVIMDLGSTYGTILGNGSKLTPNQKVLIRKGDVFYVGSQNNKFRIE